MVTDLQIIEEKLILDTHLSVFCCLGHDYNPKKVQKFLKQVKREKRNKQKPFQEAAPYLSPCQQYCFSSWKGNHIGEFFINAK